MPDDKRVTARVERAQSDLGGVDPLLSNHRVWNPEPGFPKRPNKANGEAVQPTGLHTEGCTHNKLAPCRAILPSMEKIMAYINKDKSAQIRKSLKTAFPGWKFACRIEHHSSLHVVILEAPLDLLVYQIESKHATDTDRQKYTSVNHYHLDSHWRSPAKESLRQIINICNEGNHDNSDTQSDYFDVGWYFYLSIGSWERGFVCTEQKLAA